MDKMIDNLEFLRDQFHSSKKNEDLAFSINLDNAILALKGNIIATK